MNEFINELSMSYTKKLFSCTMITCSKDAETVAREVFFHTDADVGVKEYFFVILLNRANDVIGYHKLSEGGICSTVVDIRLAFATALKSLAVAMILVHNHPSGNLKPSHQDLKLTDSFVNAGKLLEIQIFDHVIITPESYYSFADNALM